MRLSKNHYVMQMECFKFIDHILKNSSHENPVSRNTLLRECMMRFPISKKAVEEFIDGYISDMIVQEKSGMLWNTENEASAHPSQVQETTSSMNDILEAVPDVGQ